jgi:hypothetical protein
MKAGIQTFTSNIVFGRNGDPMFPGYAFGSKPGCQYQPRGAALLHHFAENS